MTPMEPVPGGLRDQTPEAALAKQLTCTAVHVVWQAPIPVFMCKPAHLNRLVCFLRLYKK